MLADRYAVIRSSQDGKYVTARPRQPEEQFVLLFREDYEARSYLNAHAGELRDRFQVESLTTSNLKDLLSRWGFQGVGIVTDALIPTIDFLTL
jgi:hypothetical protein